MNTRLGNYKFDVNDEVVSVRANVHETLILARLRCLKIEKDDHLHKQKHVKKLARPHTMIIIIA
jgi:hypothetical protein